VTKKDELHGSCFIPERHDETLAGRSPDDGRGAQCSYGADPFAGIHLLSQIAYFLRRTEIDVSERKII